MGAQMRPPGNRENHSTATRGSSYMNRSGIEYLFLTKAHLENL